MEKLAIGILAHVDAGKTTLMESILYESGSIRKPGRVDHKDAFLDHYELERERGITIFAKQAVVQIGDKRVTFLDTPGHPDFGAEMERTLQVLDYAVLLVSGPDGIQGHTLTLWKLLKRYGVPVFLFFNKMDQEGVQRNRLLEACQKQFSSRCIAFDRGTERPDVQEELAYCDEHALERYLKNGAVDDREITRLVKERKLFPCYFGSALKMTGVSQFLQGLRGYTEQPPEKPQFGARIFKIARDAQGNRLTHMKITGGVLHVKDVLTGREGQPSEKADRLRLYSGAKYEMLQEARAGTVCAVTGLNNTWAGQGLGCEPDCAEPLLEPVLRSLVCLPPDCDVHRMFAQLKELEQEEPQLHVEWEESRGEIYVRIMGEIQTDILKRMVRERFQTEITFGEAGIVYKETICAAVEGVGHFEPLRHYAEVHLLLEPGEPGSGLQLASSCGVDELNRNWQRLILTHLSEKEHRGVLTGAPVTDMKVTLVAGRAHPKHTEGGDFRQATWRAVRQGLTQADCILLEPFYDFRLELPTEHVGRAMSDIQKMSGEVEPPRTEGDFTLLTGSAPVSEMQEYQRQVIAYTKGRGRLSLSLRGYARCHNEREVIEACAYDYRSDTDNPAGSIFCAHGAGFYVNPEDVPSYMHMESCLAGKEKREEESARAADGGERRAGKSAGGVAFGREEKELAAIFERTYGSAYRNPERQRPGAGARSAKGQNATTQNAAAQEPASGAASPRCTSGNNAERSLAGKDAVQSAEEYLLVDGYNIIFAWEELKELAAANLDAARGSLMDILCNYQGFHRGTVIVVFDAYKVKDNPGEQQTYHNIHVVYTKEAETADSYIEKTVHKIGRRGKVTVATSDGLEQLIITGQGAALLSARELREEILRTQELIREQYLKQGSSHAPRLFEMLDKELYDRLEQVRMREMENVQEKGEKV